MYMQIKYEGSEGLSSTTNWGIPSILMAIKELIALRARGVVHRNPLQHFSMGSSIYLRDYVQYSTSIHRNHWQCTLVYVSGMS